MEGRALSKGKKIAMLTSTREDRAKERGVGNLREAEFQEHDTAVDAFIWFPELRAES